MVEQRFDDEFDATMGLQIDRSETEAESAAIDRSKQFALHIAGLVKSVGFGRFHFDVHTQASRC